MQTELITSQDDRGRQAVGLFAAAYDEAGLDDARAWKLNERGEELKQGCSKLIDKLSVIRPWQEQDGVIYLAVTSDGTIGPEWIERLEGKGFRIGDPAKSVLRSPDFKPTSAGVTTMIAILRGRLFKEDDTRTTQNIRAEAYAGTFTQGRKLFDPNADIACIIREALTDDYIREILADEDLEAMGLIVTMHGPIMDNNDRLSLLSASRRGAGRWLGTFCDRPLDKWHRDFGFAFAVSLAVS